MKNPRYDIIISGAGYIGSSLACLLARHGLKIALVDNYFDNTENCSRNNSPDRLFAIATASMKIFENIKIADKLRQGGQPINQILVEDLSVNGNLSFCPKDLNLENFGFMINERYLLKCLSMNIEKSSNITLFSQQEVIKIQV